MMYKVGTTEDTLHTVKIPRNCGNCVVSIFFQILKESISWKCRETLLADPHRDRLRLSSNTKRSTHLEKTEEFSTDCINCSYWRPLACFTAR